MAQYKRYLLRIRQTETPRHHIGLGVDGLQILKKTVQLLSEHYHLQPGDPLPHLPFATHHEARHRFEEQPYLFQYAHTHMDDEAIHACLHFLLHGLTIKTAEGAPVIVRPQLLRHAFDFPIQQKLPVDIVSEWLAVQKGLPYSQEREEEPILNDCIRELHLQEVIENAPPELHQFTEQARRRVGTLVPVLGGICTFDGYCPNAFRCVGCAFKIPEPEKRSHVEEKLQRAQERLAYYERVGLVLEAEKMRHLLHAGELELREMQHILEYRKDESQSVFCTL